VVLLEVGSEACNKKMTCQFILLGKSAISAAKRCSGEWVCFKGRLLRFVSGRSSRANIFLLSFFSGYAICIACRAGFNSFAGFAFCLFWILLILPEEIFTQGKNRENLLNFQ